MNSLGSIGSVFALAFLAMTQSECVHDPSDSPGVFVKDASGHLTCPRVMFAPWVSDEPLPEVRGPGYRGRIVPPAAAVAFLCQCSRNMGGPADSYWSPTQENIAELEDNLLFYIRDNPPRGRPAHWRDLALFGRLYLGVVRGGTRRISVDLFPAAPDLSEWARETGIGTICDGGSQFFGVEYDVDRHVFTFVAYNGVA
jgi:hypothetical protein